MVFWTGCECDESWFNKGTFQMVYVLQSFLSALFFLGTAYYSLLQLGHTDDAIQRYGIKASESHLKVPVQVNFPQATGLFCRRLFRWCIRKQTFACACCPVEDNLNAAIGGAMVLKGNVLQNAFFFSLFMGLWCLNPYDLLFCTHQLWTVFFVIGIPFLLWSYEAILTKWYRINFNITHGKINHNHQKTKTERLVRMIMKLVMWTFSGYATWGEYQLNRCSKNNEDCTHVLFPQTTVTTIGFFLWEFWLVVHISLFFFLFYYWGRELKKELNKNQQMQRGGLAASDAQDKDAKKKVAQSAEAANINKFLNQLTMCFILNFFTFLAYAAFPSDGPVVHLVFYIIWKVMLGFCLWCVFRCIRVPNTSWAQWVATFTCCGHKSQEAVAAGLETAANVVHQQSIKKMDSVKAGTQAFFRQGSKLEKSGLTPIDDEEHGSHNSSQNPIHVEGDEEPAIELGHQSARFDLDNPMGSGRLTGSGGRTRSSKGSESSLGSRNGGSNASGAPSPPSSSPSSTSPKASSPVMSLPGRKGP